MAENRKKEDLALQDEYFDTEEYMMEKVPMSKRHRTKDQVMVWIGFGYVVTGLVIGGQLGGQGTPGMPPSQAILAVILGMGYLFFLTGFIGIAAHKTGYNLSLLCRFSYGQKGAVLPLVMMSLMTLGWFASITGMIGDIWGAWIGNPSGVVIFTPEKYGYSGIPPITLEVFLACVVWGIVFTYTAAKGMGAIEKVANVFAPFIMIVAIIMGIVYIKQAGGVGSFMDKANQLGGLGMGTAISAVVGSWIAGAIMGADLLRFNKNVSSVWWCCAACFIFTNPILNIVGYIGAVHTGDFNYVMYMLGVNVFVAIIGVAVWTFALWTTNNGELYCNSLYTGPVLHTFGKKVSRRGVVIVIGSIGTILGALAFYQLFFAKFINVLGVMGPPIASPILADFFITGHKRKYDEALLNKQPAFRWAGLISFIIGAIVAIIFSYVTKLPWDFPSGVFAMIVSFVVYILIYKLTPDAKKDEALVAQLNQ